MKERHNPNWLGRAAIALTTLGAIGSVGTIADAVIDNNVANKNVDRALPQIPSFEELIRAEKAIGIFDLSTELIRQGKTVIDIPNLPELQQSKTLVSEYNKRQRDRSQLKFELRESGNERSFIGMLSSIFLLTTATVLLQQQHSKRPDGNQQKNTQQTNPTA